MKVRVMDSNRGILLRSLIDRDYYNGRREEGCVFEYEGNFYAKISKSNSVRAGIRVEDGFIPCFNLKIRSVRGIKADAIVFPVNAEVNITYAD